MCENNRPIFDESIVLADNAMLKHRPDLFDQWNFEKNDELGISVYEITKGTTKKAFWVCIVCKSSYERTVEKAVLARQCPYCLGYKVNDTNSLATLKPEVAIEWHPTKNGDLTANDVTCGKGIKVWWLGQCGHEWEMTILKRAGRGDKCPYCSSKKVLIGFNDMWTTNPNLASQLANQEDGFKYTQHSNVRVKWKCLTCGRPTGKLVITAINREGVSCPLCSDGISYGEKFLYSVLESSGVKFEYEKTFNWSQGKRYDFYLNEKNWVIEVHGAQHYGGGFSSYWARTYKDEVDNDLLKEMLANENGIDNYIVIDARKSSSEFLVNSIKNSQLNRIVSMKNINIQEIEKRISTSLVVVTCQLWQKGMSTMEIVQHLKLSGATIRNYLKKGRTAGLCVYDEAENRVRHSKKEIVQISPQGDYIKTWNSVREAAHFFNVSASAISRCAKGGRPKSAGFKWILAEEYYK